MNGSIIGFGCGAGTVEPLPIPDACGSFGSPLASQIRALLIGPTGSAPSDWTDRAAVEAFANGAGSYFPCTGEVPRPEVQRGQLGRPTNGSAIAASKKYAASLESALICDAASVFVYALRKNWRGFRFWLLTDGGRIIGGAAGIKPRYVESGSYWPGGRGEHELYYISLEWYGAEPLLADYVPGIGDNTGGGDAPEPPETFCEMYSQYYANQVGNVLSWTTNGGAVPTPTNTRFWVFQQGQKLDPAQGQYTINANASAGTSLITINTNTHYDTADYTIFSFPG